jgi:hypothetical protein
VSQHVKVPRDAGLISGEPEGTPSCYCPDARDVPEAARSFAALAGALAAPACGPDGCDCG